MQWVKMCMYMEVVIVYVLLQMCDIALCNLLVWLLQATVVEITHLASQ